MTFSIRRALILAFAGLVAFITIVLFSVSIVQRDRLVEDLSPMIIGRAQQHVSAEMKRLFDGIEAHLVMHRWQAENGMLARYDTPALKDLLLPSMLHTESVGSMMVGDTTGYQLLLMRYDSLVTRSPLLEGQAALPQPSERPQYFTREFRARVWGERSEWTLWDPSGEHVQARWTRNLAGYDPTQRAWYLRALERLREVEAAGGSDEAEDYVAWTDVYTMFTSKTPGISASIAVRDPGGQIVIIAIDLLLDNLGAFLAAQRPTANGKVFVISDSGEVLGMPADRRFTGQQARLAALLQPLDAVGSPELSAWAERWNRNTEGAPFEFSVDGKAHWGSALPFPLGVDRRLWVAVSVPEDDLLATTQNDRWVIGALAALTLLGGILLSLLISRSMTRPLTALLDRSRRIGALELDPEAPPASRLAEVRELGDSIEHMGRALREHIDERERARAAVAEGEERFRSTFEQAAVGLCHVSPEGRFLRVNQRMCDIVGYAREELLTMGFRDITAPDVIPSDNERLKDMLENRTRSVRFEKRYVHKSGAEVWAHVTSSLLRDDAGRPQYFITVVQDISERKSLETQLRQAQKLEAVGQLAGGVAHDFNNLLTVISGHASLARAALPEGHPILADLDEVDHASRRAADLTRQLLAFARREIVEPRVISPAEVVSSSLGMLRRLIGEHIDLHTTIDPDVQAVRIDPGQLHQVLLNLLVNARDAMPDGGRVTIRVSNVTLGKDDVRALPELKPGPYVELRVSDTGTGMSPDVLARVFEPFFTTKAPGRGSGLGLSTCYGIVRQAGGLLRVESAPGHGATFQALLPALSDVPADSNVNAAHPSPGGRETILLAEDEPGIRALSERVLTERGYTVHAAPDGAAALEWCVRSGTQPDLLVTDLIMPGMSGRELAERLVAQRPGLRVLYVSGYGQDTLRGDLPEGLHFLSKPYRPDDLVRKVREVLDMPRDQASRPG